MGCPWLRERRSSVQTLALGSQPFCHLAGPPALRGPWVQDPSSRPRFRSRLACTALLAVQAAWRLMQSIGSRAGAGALDEKWWRHGPALGGDPALSPRRHRVPARLTQSWRPVTSWRVLGSWADPGASWGREDPGSAVLEQAGVALLDHYSCACTATHPGHPPTHPAASRQPASQRANAHAHAQPRLPSHARQIVRSFSPAGRRAAARNIQFASSSRQLKVHPTLCVHLIQLSARSAEQTAV